MDKKSSVQSTDYQLAPDGRFWVRQYGLKKPFSNFLPGIAGVYGTPMWVFYVNRGQGVVSFGTRDKDHAILEFYPANKAYQVASTYGFRTFLKVRKNSNGTVLQYEPFRHSGPSANFAHQNMQVCSYELSLEEKNISAGLETVVRYFTLAGDPVAALVREVQFTNITSSPLDVEMLDGLPQIQPYGMNDWFMKHMSRTIEAWMQTENIDKKAPFLRLKVDATDRPEVTFIEGGNFFFGLSEGPAGRTQMLEPFVDPVAIFGACSDFAEPTAFYQDPHFGPDKQITSNRTPCAFGHTTFRLAPGKSKTFRFCYGYARNMEIFNRFVSRAKRPGFFAAKREENRRVIEGVKAPIFSITASPTYDHYCGQTYLDNVMRGGMPLVLGEGEDSLPLYVYSRKHGDLERDYNNFLVEDSYFAQGDGNYRDVNQNRRNDVWFEPRIGDSNIRTFMNLLQLDGYNPLVVKGTDFYFKKTAASSKVLNRALGRRAAQATANYLKEPFKIGELFRWLESKGWITPGRFERLLKELVPFLSREEQANHGEGFWVDHWTYNLDLVESYLAIYPEKLRHLLLEDETFIFFDNDHVVRPRQEKYFNLPGRGIRQYKSVHKDAAKAELMASRTKQKHAVRERQGKGEVYRTTLMGKLACLFTLKFASLDAQGVGIEMDADKPSWYDALNGLPGLAGSSLCESFELKRLAIFLIQSIDELGPDGQSSVNLPVELYELVSGLEKLLDRHVRDKFQRNSVEFWDEATTLKESYRARISHGVTGSEKGIELSRLRTFLEHAREKIEIGLQKAWDAKTGLYPTYFENEVKRFQGKTSVFTQKPLPLFLEGLVHAMKVEKDPHRRKALYRAVRKSSLYDEKLGMYKVNGPIREASYEVGRARVFTPGWLENESVWLHMEYKYLLEMLKAGLHEEFFQDFKKALVPFQPAERYGRSVLENSSFIVSSVFPDPSFHGAGFVARLSGSTAEVLNMWLLMNIGKKPFVLGPDKKLSLRFEPHLPSFLFTQKETVRVFVDQSGQERAVRVPKDSVAFMFLGKTLVVYHNSKRLDTFGKLRVSVKKVCLQDTRGNVTEFKGDTVPAPYSLKVRDGFVPRIDIELG